MSISSNNFSNEDLDNWHESVWRPFRIFGDAKKLEANLKKEGKKVIGGRFHGDNDDWVLPQPTTFEEKIQYSQLDIDMNKMCEIRLLINDIDKEKEKFIRSHGAEELDRIKRFVRNKRQEINSRWSELSENTQTHFKAQFDRINSTLPFQNEEDRTNLSIPQIALIHVYFNKQITRANANDIAANYNFTSNTSGEKLYQRFIEFRSKANRQGDAGSLKKNSNKIILLESIINHLPFDKQDLALQDISILKATQKSNYPEE